MKITKNNKQIFSLIQSLGYILQESNHKYKGRTLKVNQKREINQMISFIKEETQKLKRI